MIYVSTSCVKHNKIYDSVLELANLGFKNIELSGGTELYKNFESDLMELKEKYELNYLCHNYFPPPTKPFVLNLASLDDETFQASFDHLSKVIALSKALGADKYAFHAGFFIDIKLSEIGRKLTKENLYDEDEAETRFCSAYRLLQKQTENLNLYIENNVFSGPNSVTFSERNPFMLTNFSSYKSLKEKINFNLLLDVAHLKVSSQSLGLNWPEEFENMINETDYIHISDNDGSIDSNNELVKYSELYHMIKETNTKNKTFTLEVYDGIDALRNSYQVLSEVIT